MRILHVISSIDPRTGGPSTALLGLSVAQARAGLKVSVAATWSSGESTELGEKMNDAGVAVRLIGPCAGKFKSHPDLGGTVHDAVAAADVVHIHALWEEIQHQAAGAARRAGIPYIFRPCGMLDPWSLKQSKWKKRLYMKLRLRSDLNQATALHFTSEIERDLVLRMGLRPTTIVEPNGVDLSEFDQLPERGIFRVKYPVIGDRPLVLFLSRVHPKKGLDLLVPAFGRVAARDAVLVIAGPDDAGYAQTVRKMAEQAGVADRVLFTGMLRGRDRVEALADADLFVLPSYQENFGIVVVEALAAGAPVIISDQVNIYREVVRAGVGAAVATKIEPLAAKLEQWLSDSALRVSAAGRAGQFVRERYDWNQIARRWLAHYARLLRGGAAS